MISWNKAPGSFEMSAISNEADWDTWRALQHRNEKFFFLKNARINLSKTDR